MMEDNFTRNFIDSIANGDNIEAEKNFDFALSQKLGDALENKRAEVAKTFVSKITDDETV